MDEKTYHRLIIGSAILGVILLQILGEMALVQRRRQILQDLRTAKTQESK